MGIDSKLVIKPKFKTHNVGFAELWGDIETSMQAAGFKSPLFREKPHIDYLPNVKFEYSLGTLFTSYPILVPVPDSKDDFPYEQRSLFFWYADLKNCDRADEDRESMMVKLGWHLNYKLAFFLMAYSLVDKYIIDYLDNDCSGQTVRIYKEDIEAYLKEIGVALPEIKKTI